MSEARLDADGTSKLSGTTEAADARRERVTACLIVQDEQRNLPGALDSVSFCDEIVLVDGGSSDRTVEIAHERGVTVIENPWPGFAAQRNVALDAATSEWVFELDADERVTPRLRASIQELLASSPGTLAIAVCPSNHWFLGRLLEASAKYPAYRSRLFRRGAYRHEESRGVHEGLEPRERPALLSGALEHELARTLGEALHDVWRYAQLESTHLQRPSGSAAYLKGIVLRPGAKILYRTLVDGGWRDGWQGMLKIFLDACSDALVWTRVLFGAGKSPSADQAQSPSEEQHNRHFGRRPAGPGKVVALAGRGAATQAARQWLAELHATGIDVTLISEQPNSSSAETIDDATFDFTDVIPNSTNAVPVRAVRRLRPLATMRALDIEMQLRTIHAVVPFGRRARFVWHLLPSTLRPEIAGFDADSDPAQVGFLGETWR